MSRLNLTQAILPVAGLGTRFLPWTKVVPKELLPIGSVPIIALLVDECLQCGIRDVCFVISPGKESIPAYFQKNPVFEEELRRRGKLEALKELERYHEMNFHVAYQHEQLGDGHAVLQATDWVQSDVIAVLFGDDLFAGPRSGLEQLAMSYELIGCEHVDHPPALLSLERIPRERTRMYGVVSVEMEHPKNPRIKRLSGLVEKPLPGDAPSELGVVGKYLIPRSILNALPHVRAGANGEIRLIDAFIAECKRTPIYGYECEGVRYDTGTPEGYRKAVLDLGR